MWALGPLEKVKGGGQSAEPMSNFSILKTVEQNWDLPLLGHAADPEAGDLSSLMIPAKAEPTVPPPASGNATSEPSGAPAPGASSVAPPSAAAPESSAPAVAGIVPLPSAAPPVASTNAATDGEAGFGLPLGAISGIAAVVLIVVVVLAFGRHAARADLEDEAASD
jgi:hypothetical protein